MREAEFNKLVRKAERCGHWVCKLSVCELAELKVLVSAGIISDQIDELYESACAKACASCSVPGGGGGSTFPPVTPVNPGQPPPPGQFTPPPNPATPPTAADQSACLRALQSLCAPGVLAVIKTLAAAMNADTISIAADLASVRCAAGGFTQSDVSAYCTLLTFVSGNLASFDAMVPGLGKAMALVLPAAKICCPGIVTPGASPPAGSPPGGGGGWSTPPLLPPVGGLPALPAGIPAEIAAWFAANPSFAPAQGASGQQGQAQQQQAAFYGPEATGTVSPTPPQHENQTADKTAAGVGAVAGGALGSTFGPVGTMVGSAVGGAVAGAAWNAVESIFGIDWLCDASIVISNVDWLLN